MSYGDASMAVGLGIMAFGFLFLLLAIGVRIAAVWWVYTDANRRGRTDAVLWAFLAFLSPLLFLIVYLLIREQRPASARQPERVCPGCGRPVGSDDHFCPHCGKYLQTGPEEPSQPPPPQA